jgi:multicomponent Na+:H+ antiporter subunit G
MIPEIVAAALLFSGAVFCIVGTIGVLRFPDLFTRMHAAGITDTLGALLVLAGLMVLAGWSLATAKLIFILAFLWMTSPTVTHTLATAARHGRVFPLIAGEKHREEQSSKR